MKPLLLAFIAFLCVSSAAAQQQKTQSVSQKAAQAASQTSVQTPEQPALQAAPQDVSGIRFGAFGGFGVNLSTANFLQLSDTPEANRENPATANPFGNGLGTGWSAGVLVEFPLTKWLNVGVRASAVRHDASLLSEPFAGTIGRSDGSESASSFQRRFNLSMLSGGAEVLLGITPFGSFNIYLGARGEFAGIRSFEQWEELREPSDGTFENGERRRNFRTALLPALRNLGIANFNAALVGGLGYEFALNNARSWTVEPNVFASYGLFNVLQEMMTGEYWKLNGVRAGLAVRHYPARDAAFDEQDFKVKQLVALEQQITKERTKIQEQLRELKSAGVSVKLSNVVGIQADGKEVPDPTIRVEQFQASNTTQILNYVFFADNSSVISARYRRVNATERQTFNLESLASLPPLATYYHLLNIVGKRMQDNPQAKLTLTGCNANAGVEKGNRKLSRQRAEAVSDYLQDVWKIPAARIQITDRDLPEQPSITSGESGLAENRRVEITADNPKILQPLTFDNTFRIVTPPSLRVDLEISAGAGLKQWALEISQLESREAKTLKSVEGGANYPKQLTWNIDEDQNRIPNASGAIDIKLDITDITNRAADAPIVGVPVEVITLADKRRKNTPDKRIDIFTFGVFGSETAQTTNDPTTQALIQTVKSRTRSNSTVVIEGYVEGEDDGSLDTFLSEQRAGMIAKALNATGTLGATVKTITATKGNTQQKVLRNDATLPEGRFYNRSVRVEVQTPTR